MTRPSLVSDERQRAIVEAYKSGAKLRDIESEFEVTRSQVYWVLQQNQVAPARTKQKSRLDDGDERTLVRLYEVVEAQDARLRLYEELINLLQKLVKDSTLTVKEGLRYATLLKELDIEDET